MGKCLGISLFLISTTGVQAAVQYTYSAPALSGESATQLTYTAMAFVTANTTINLPDPSVVVTTPTTGSVPTQIQILSPTTTSASFNVTYSDGTTLESTFGVNFIHEGSFSNGLGVRLTITAVPVFTKSFVPSTILLNGTSTLSFNISNPTLLTMMDVDFTDALPAGVNVAFDGQTGSCGAGSSFGGFGGSVSLTSGTLAPGATCTLSVIVVGTIEGSHVNSAQVTTFNEGNGGTATATLLVGGDPFLVSYAANLNVGESFIDIGNTGANGAPLLGPGFGGAAGNICANVYAFDSGEELVACCSCLITPDQTVNLGVNRDLTVKTLTGTVPTSVTIKVLATLAGAGGTGTSCTNSAAMVATATLANGVAAWGTTLHATPTAAFATTERPFSGATLSEGELASMGGRCASILGNGSTFGVCNSCRSGALGGSSSQQ